MVMRYLVVANQTLGGASVTAAVTSKAREGASVHIVVPATDPAHDASAQPGSTAVENAQRRLDRELHRFREAGVEATGEVGATDPMRAIRDAISQSHYSGLVISTLPARVSRWLHVGLPHRAVREFGLPVEWVEARGDDDEPAIVHIEVPAAAQRALHSPRIERQHTPPRQT